MVSVRRYNKLTLSGLVPGQVYEFTGYARDHFNGGTDSFQAWSDRGFLGVRTVLVRGWMPTSARVRFISPPPVASTIRFQRKSVAPTSGPAAADPYGARGHLSRRRGW